MFTEENWKPVREFPDHYEISNLGRLRRTKPYRGVEAGRIRKPQMIGKYPGYMISISQAAFARMSHRLVADAFLGPIPEGMQVNHIDGDKMNCHVSNLEIVTNSENRIHSYRVLGIKPNGGHGVRNANAKLTPEKAADIRKRHSEGESYRLLALHYGVTKQAVASIIKGKTWKQD
jgi:hypothetical protein